MLIDYEAIYPLKVEISDNTFDRIISIHEDTESIIYVRSDGENLAQYANDRTVTWYSDDGRAEEVTVKAPYMKILNNVFDNNYIHEHIVNVSKLTNVEISGN